jgi:predicted metal-binding membrane protein
MLPAAVPALRLYRQLASGRELIVFAAGYTAVWVAIGLAAMQVMPPLAGTLAVAGAYQLSPVQAGFLGRCRSPLGLLVRRRALPAGIEYGVTCGGCCAGLMLLLAALGASMSVLWMTALALFVLAEKTLRRGQLVARLAGVAVIAVAVGISL